MFKTLNEGVQTFCKTCIIRIDLAGKVRLTYHMKLAAFPQLDAVIKGADGEL